MKFIEKIDLSINYVLHIISKKYIKHNSNLNKFRTFLLFLNFWAFSVFIPSFITYLNFVMYWFSLGILSTIGFGFGLQTGILFLLPNVISIYNNNTENNNTSKTSNNINIFLKCLPSSIIWGIGSAFGELPPFFFAKYYKKSYSNTYIEKMKDTFFYKKMEFYLKKNKFFIILGLAAWPNITFDMCGVLCGYYNFSIYEFLVPTIIGKAFLKTIIQLISVLFFYDKIIINNPIISKYNINYFWFPIMLSIISYFFYNIINYLSNQQIKLIK